MVPWLGFAKSLWNAIQTEGKVKFYVYLSIKRNLRKNTSNTSHLYLSDPLIALACHIEINNFVWHQISIH